MIVTDAMALFVVKHLESIAAVPLVSEPFASIVAVVDLGKAFVDLRRFLTELSLTFPLVDADEIAVKRGLDSAADCETQPESLAVAFAPRIVTVENLMR